MEQDEMEEQDDDETAFDRVHFPFGDERAPMVINDERPDLSTAEIKLKSQKQLKKKEKKSRLKSRNASIEKLREDVKEEKGSTTSVSRTLDSLTNIVITTAAQVVSSISPLDTVSATTAAAITKAVASSIITSAKNSKLYLSIDAEVAVTMVTAVAQCAVVSLTGFSSPTYTISNNNFVGITSPRKGRREEGWKEVTRSIPQTRAKKILIPASLISRVIGRGGCNVNAIREYTSAHIDIDTNRKKSNGDCMVTIKGSQQSIRQASNLVQSLIDDPERDVTEILPANVIIPPPVVKTEHLQLPNAGTGSPVLSKSLNTQRTLLKPNPTQRQFSAPASIIHQPIAFDPRNSPDLMSKRPPTRTVSTVITDVTTVTSSSTVMSLTKCKSVPSWGVSSDGDNNDSVPVAPTIVSIMTTENNRSVISTTQVSPEVKAPTARKLFSPSISSNSAATTTVLKPLPKPIGSNRPHRAFNQQSVVSSTSVSESITASLHTTLTNLLSQVATQRSPMIWNDRPGANDFTLGGDVVVTTMANSPTNISTVAPDRFAPGTLSQNSSQESFKAHSRTPSLSPTSNHSNSPTPEERPHLNPIGSERGFRKPQPKHAPNLGSMEQLLQGADPAGQSLWHFDYRLNRPPSWSSAQTPLGWVNEHPKNMVNSHQTRVNGDIEHEQHIGASPNDTLESFLERLSLSNHLNLFQTNEIDLDALMLMSEQDYADIGLPKEPRAKLLNSMRHLRPEMNGTLPRTNADPYHRPLNEQPFKLPQQHPSMWNHISQGIDPNLSNIPQHDTRLPPGLHTAMAYQPTQLTNSWQQWSSTVDQ